VSVDPRAYSLSVPIPLHKVSISFHKIVRSYIGIVKAAVAAKIPAIAPNVFKAPDSASQFYIKLEIVKVTMEITLM